MRRDSTRIGWLFLTALAITLAFGLRTTRIDNQSLWYDEGASARASERPAGQIIRDTARDIHPPGYYLLLAGWEDFAGASDLALRLPSALFGALAAALVYAIGSRFFGRWVGLVAAVLAAANPFQVWYGQEARMYAMLGAVSAASVLLAGEVLKIPARMAAGRFVPRRAAAIIGAYIAVNALGLYTHYTFPFVLLAESLVFVVWLLGRPKKLHGLVTWVLIQLAGLALFAPWLPTAFRQLTTWPRVPSQAVGPLDIAGAVAYGLTTPLDTAHNALIPLGLLALVGLFPPFEEEDRPLRFGERIGFVALWLLMPIAVPVALGVVREPFLKFFVPAGLALQIIAARGIVMGIRLGAPLPGASALNAWLTRLIVIALAIAGIVLPVWTGLRNLYFDPAYARDDYRGIAQRILEEAGPEAAVVLDAPSQVEVFSQYYPDGPGVTPLPDDQTEQSIARLLADYDRIYALFWGESEQDPERTVENTLNASAFAASSDWYGGVRLVTYVVPDAPAAEPDVLIDAGFGDAITLAGYAVSDTAVRPGEALAVTLFWRADAPVETRYKVFVHLYYPDGTIAAQHDGEPGGGLQPTDGWGPGEVVADNHGLLVPADAPEGDYALMVGLYGLDETRLPVTRGEDAGDQRLALTAVEVAR